MSWELWGVSREGFVGDAVGGIVLSSLEYRCVSSLVVKLEAPG